MTQFCTFTLAGQLFGIDVGEVQEVVLPQEMTRVPLAPAIVRGLINLRGQIVMAIDLRKRLGLPPRKVGEQPINLVARSEHGAVSFLIDEIRDVVTVDDSRREATPDTVRQAIREVVRGVYKLEGRLLLVLDKERVLTGEPVPAARSSDEDARPHAAPVAAASGEHR
jgi:purine-binding chemotaxis protein CheW